jgi:hypothetical protein
MGRKNHEIQSPENTGIKIAASKFVVLQTPTNQQKHAVNLFLSRHRAVLANKIFARNPGFLSHCFTGTQLFALKSQRRTLEPKSKCKSTNFCFS